MSQGANQIVSNIEERIHNDDLVDLVRKQEQPFISILLKDKDCLMDAVSYGIKPEHFWDRNCRFLFRIILKNYQDHSSILTRSAMDNIMDMAQMESLTDEKKAFYKKYWHEVYFIEAPLEDYDLLKTSINNRYVQWQAFKIMDEYSQKVVHSINNQAEMVREITDKWHEIDNVDPDSYGIIMDFDHALDKSMEYINHKRDNPKDVQGVMSGIKGIDSIFCGFDKGSYTVITGFINGCKTTLMFNMAFNMAKAGYNVVYVSLEKQAISLTVRLHSLHAMVDYNRIKRGGKGDWGLCDEVYSNLKDAYKELKENIKPQFDIIELPQTVKLSRIMADVDKIKSRKKIDVLVVDYLQAIGFESNHPSRPDLDLAQISQRLQAYGRINKFVTITALQIKTESTKDIRKKVQGLKPDNDLSSVGINVEDLSGSKQITADADNAIGVVKDYRDNPVNKVFVNVIKARDSDPGRRIQLDFNGGIGRIADLEFEPGQIREVDDLIYNKRASEEALKNDDDDDLFKSKDVSKNKSAEPITTSTTSTPNNADNKSSSSSSNDTNDLDKEINKDNKDNKFKNNDIDDLDKEIDKEMNKETNNSKSNNNDMDDLDADEKKHNSVNVDFGEVEENQDKIDADILDIDNDNVDDL